MLVDQIAELMEKVMGKRVLNAEGPTMETSVLFSGKFKGQTSIDGNTPIIIRAVELWP